MNNFSEAFLKNIATNKVQGDFMPYNKNYLVHHEDLFKYLVITKDEKRLHRYLKFVMQRLNQIAEKAYATYLQKIEALKNNI
jgi:hypothetical protein